MEPLLVQEMIAVPVGEGFQPLEIAPVEWHLASLPSVPKNGLLISPAMNPPPLPDRPPGPADPSAHPAIHPEMEPKGLVKLPLCSPPTPPTTPPGPAAPKAPPAC